MNYEFHITLAVGDDDIDDLPAGWKLTTIVLSCGQHPVQPMISNFGDWSVLAEALSKLGSRVKRYKVEQDLTDDFGPIHVRGGEYFEHHIKVFVPKDSETPIAALAMRHCGHLSRNAKKTGESGGEYFITQRNQYMKSLAESNHYLKELLVTLAKEQVLVLQIEQELVIYDSNKWLDNGWTN